MAYTPTLIELRDRAAQDLDKLGTELSEIELLAQQARAEASRYETKRSSTADRVAALTRTQPVEPPEAIELATQLVTLTRKASLMEAQVEVLDGKAKVLGRYRDAMHDFAMAIAALVEAMPASLVIEAEAGSEAGEGAGARGEAGGEAEEPIVPPAVSRLVLSAQEDLRREIARAMHDGPAQSLTNIVLQAQIVDRLLARDPEQARGEIRQLVAMVQSTLDATKSFIFDVRPMVLDDLGLVPTLRRAARERGRRAHVPVEFDSFGADRRMAMEVEGGFFRILDETLGGFLASSPDRVTIRLDWGEQVEALVTAERVAAAPAPAAAAASGGTAAPSASAPGASGEPWVPLSATAWREIQGRAATLGISAELLAEGSQVLLVIDKAASHEAA
jgi:two-component system sensor histidine kinase DegS